MGFYSLYRIIKDVIKSILGNKAWKYTLIIALIVTFFTIYSTKVNAEEVHDHVVDYYTTWNYTSGTSTHQLIFVPVFANSSYSISWASGNNVVFSFIDSLSRVDNSQSVPMSTIGSNDQGSFGYFATKDGYLVLDHYSTDFSHPTYTITTDYQFTANLQTIHDDLSTIIDYLYGTPTELTSEFSVVNNLTIDDPTSNGSFSTTSSASRVFYMPLENGRITNLDFTVTLNPTYSYVVVGYCDSIPSNGVSYIHYSHYSGSGSFNITGSFSSHKYLFVRTIGGSVTINSSSVNNIGLEGMNNNATYQAEATRQTLTDSNISQDSSDYSLPTDSTNDITASGFASIFDRIKNTFTSPTSTPIVINVPFTGKTFTISKQTVYGSANLGIVQTLIECFWWYIIALFVCKDVFKKIEKLKTGNIEFTETTNIKEDIL